MNMKKTSAVLLVLALLVSALTGCGAGNKDTGSETTNYQTENTYYEYLFRDLPEAKYITPAAEFAGGEGTEEDPYQISNAAELALLHEKMVEEYENLKNHYKRAHYILTADISLNDTSDFDHWETAGPEYSWMPIGFDTTSFSGVFDGNGYTISGLYINTNCGMGNEYSFNNYGLFDTVNSTVKNVKVDKSYIAVSGSPHGVGSIAGALTNEAILDNCSSNAVMNCYENSCGGIAGVAYGGVDTGIVDEGEEREIKYSTISNCSFAGQITQAKDGAMTYIGGIIGECDGNIDACVNNGTIIFAGDNVDSVGGIAGRMSEGTISNCENLGSLICQTSETGFSIAGGIVGKVFVSATGSEKYMSRGATIKDCENSGTVEGQMYAGGIAGQFSNDRNDYCSTISGCVNTGVVTAVDYTGGIIGRMDCIGDNANGNSLLVENCENRAALSTGSVGGIVGQFVSDTGNVTVKKCGNFGELTSDGQHCGGIIGYWLMKSRPKQSVITIDGCTNSGDINTTLSAGGIISYMDMPICLSMEGQIAIYVVNCTNNGDISTSALNGYIGGILGNWGMKDIPTTVDNCTNNGTLVFTKHTNGMTHKEAEIMTVSRIAGGIVGRVGEGLLLTTDNDEADNKNIQAADAVLKITNSKNTGKLEVVDVDAQNIKNWFGGIIGNTCGEDGFSVLVENCTYTEFDRGLGNENLTDVGTKN